MASKYKCFEYEMNEFSILITVYSDDSCDAVITSLLGQEHWIYSNALASLKRSVELFCSNNRSDREF